MDGPETSHKGSDIDIDVRGGGGLILVRGGVKFLEASRTKKKFLPPPKSQRDFFLPPLNRVKCSLYYTPSIDDIRLILV